MGPVSQVAKVTASNKTVTFGIPHMEWDEEKKRFHKQLPRPPPIIKVNVTLMEDAHKDFGIYCKERPSREVEAVADTGCQTSTCGVDIMKSLRIPARYLIPTSHGIMGITDTRLNIIGTLMLKITYMEKTTRQMVYVTSNSMGLYLSEKALSDLGLIDSKFPSSQDSKAAPAKISPVKDECECIPHEPAPEPSEQIPYPATEDKKLNLKSWLVERFKSSAFNTCEHQPLKEMTGDPMKIHFKDSYTPHAVHTPIPIPHHWEEKVKKDIDRDVKLDILEKVPEG